MTKGYLRLHQIIGQQEVTPEDAARNRELARSNKSKTMQIKVGPQSPRPFIQPLVPWSKSKLWDAVKKGEFPAPVKLSERTTAWTVESVMDFLTSKQISR